MLFPEEDAPLLKAWIVKRIEDTSDADAEVLAEYIIALLKHDGTKDDVRRLCESEIPDFLTEDPKAFLDDVFQAIAYKSYVPGAPPPPKLPQSAVAPAQQQQQQTQQNQPPPPHPQQFAGPPGPDAHGVQGVMGLVHPSGPRKRTYRDYDAPAGPEAYYNGHRPMKNPRRHGQWQGRGDGFVPSEFLPMGIPPFDPENPMASLMNMGMPYSGLPPFPGQDGKGGRPRKKGRCRDFDTKGFCARGSSCMYGHGNEQSFMPPIGRADQQEYDPENPTINLSGPNSHANTFAINPSPYNAPRGRGGRKGGRGARRNGGRAPFSAEGPVHDRSKSTIVVENIPEEHFAEEEVRGFFSQFGTITEVSMQPYKHLATVKYDNWGSANAAYRSPKVIFDNRFVKVFWYKDEADNSLLPTAASSGHLAAGDSKDAMDGEPEMDPEEFQRRQEEAQKQFQERESKRSELQRQREELERKQQELMDRHREAAESLRSKMLEKNGSGNNSIDGGTEGEEHQEVTGTDMLRAKLAALEQEAKFLGIDPDAVEDTTTSYPPRGGWRGGRAVSRATPRGRGAWRGGRASFRGVAGRHAAYAQYSLDNRPKRLAITGADFSVPEKDESLRHFLLNLGEFESVEPSSTTTYVSFRDRKTAEKLYNSLHGKELPGVEGKLELAWAGASPAPVPMSALPAKKDDDVMGEDAEAASGLPEQDPAADMEYREERVEDEDAY